MRVYSCPKEVPAPEIDWSGSMEDWEKAEEKHMDALKQYLIKHGYTGKHTGRVLKVPIADGYALYMLADAPRKSCLFHLPYGDAWHSPDVGYLPKYEVLKRIERDEGLAKLFAIKKTVTADEA